MTSWHLALPTRRGVCQPPPMGKIYTCKRTVSVCYSVTLKQKGRDPQPCTVIATLKILYKFLTLTRRHGRVCASALRSADPLLLHARFHPFDASWPHYRSRPRPKMLINRVNSDSMWFWLTDEFFVIVQLTVVLLQRFDCWLGTERALSSFIAYSAGAFLCPQCAASRHE